AFTIKAKHDIKQYTVKGEQHWEFIESENRRYEKNLGTTYATKFYNIQTQNPEAAFMSSTAGVERWYKKEKVFSSLYYRFARVKNSEQENLREYDENLNPMSFSTNAEQKFNARADNHMDLHTLVANLMGSPWSWLAINTKLKTELKRARGNSIYPSDRENGDGVRPSATVPEPPDGIIDENTFSDNKNRTFRNGQGISIRFKKIPRTALYTEFDIEETRNWLSEHRWSIGVQRTAGTDFFDRRTVIDMIRGTGTVGGDFSPVRYINTTAQFRYRYDNVTYDDKYETEPPTTTAKSAFFDEMDTETVEFNTRTTLRIVRWLQPSFRYIVRDIDYLTRTEGEAQLQSDVLLNDYIYDLTFMPLPSVIITGSFARELLSTKTAANSFTGSSIPLPGFDAGVNTWLFSVGYTPKENLSIMGTLSQSQADNFDDYANIGIPLGADFNRVTAIFGLKWTVKKDITIEPEYAYYHYGANPHADAGSYDAHLVGLEVSLAWG
ncbi:MAG: hypothetical protein HYS55_05455, partial [Candidatus Omnitrophica bacterium]|nr:hypothetical protein [Candidatus Omnitrophota bacterium]